MILVDANLLIYAHVTSLPQYHAARVWLDARLNGPTQVGLPWPTLLSFACLVSNFLHLRVSPIDRRRLCAGRRMASLSRRMDSPT